MRRRSGFAVLLASVALPCASGAASANSGLLPDEPVSAGPATAPSLAMAPNGYAAVAWVETLTGRLSAIGVATRPPGGTWSRPQLLDASDDQKFSVTVAVDASGAAVVAWTDVVSGESFVRVSSRAAGGGFTAPELLDDARSIASPAVGIVPSGRVTLLYDPSPGVAVRDFQAGSSVLAARPQTVSSGMSASCVGSALAVAPSGDAVAGYNCGGAVFALRRAGSWNASPPVADDVHACPGVSTVNDVSGVAIDAQGNAAGLLTTRLVDTTAVGDPMFCTILPARESDAVHLVLPLAGVMTPLVGTVAAGVNDARTSSAPLGSERLASSPNGIVVAWLGLADDAMTYRVHVRDIAADGAPLGSDTTIDPVSPAQYAQLAAGADGHALLVWARQASLGLPLPLEAATRPSGGAFDAPLDATADASLTTVPALAVDDAGNGAVAYVSAAPAGLLHVRGVDGAAPALSGVAIPASAVAGRPAAFAATAGDVWGPVTLGWNFGDGAGGSGGAPPHTYARAGRFAVAVAATDAFGNAVSSSGVVRVLPARVQLTHVSLVHRRFRVGRGRTAVSARRRRVNRAPVGTTFRFTLDRAASVTIAFAQRASGLRSGRRCV
ncbi:MAG TPA: PKD domain-containing protein, partial [Conexibacter sp.]|nr:PKD domain-containing protein [Conexibacter sp.]